MNKTPIQLPEHLLSQYNNLTSVKQVQMCFTIKELKEANVTLFTKSDKYFGQDPAKTKYSWGAKASDKSFFVAFDWKVFPEDEESEIEFDIDLYGEWPEDVSKVEATILRIIGIDRGVNIQYLKTSKFEAKAIETRFIDAVNELKKIIIDAVSTGGITQVNALKGNSRVAFEVVDLGCKVVATGFKNVQLDIYIPNIVLSLPLSESESEVIFELLLEVKADVK